MSQWLVFAGLVIGVPILLIAVAALLPCDGCRLRRERIARAVAKLRERQNQSN